MIYSITIEELIWRPIIRYDYNDEWMNKMTDDEIDQYNKELNDMVSQLSIEEHMNCIASKTYDRNVLYGLFMLCKPRLERIKKLDSL